MSDSKPNPPASEDAEPTLDEAQAFDEARAVDSAEEVEGSAQGVAPDAPESAPYEPPSEEAYAALAERAADADRLADRLKRVEAEFVNETRRIRRQAESDRKFAVDGVVKDLLPVLDALFTARKNLGDSEVEQATAEGLDLVVKELESVLSRYGIEKIEAEGQAFDPARHEALYPVPTDEMPPQQVLEVLRDGYSLHGRVVRPTQVAVSAALPQASQGGEGN